MARGHIRAAVPDDAPGLVDFVLMAGEGLPELAWADMAGPGEDIRAAGLRRAQRDEGATRLYLRAGYTERARRRMNIPGRKHDGDEAVLLLKSLA